MKFFILTAFICLANTIAHAQDSSITWEENRVLQWTDFAGKECDTSKFDAECYAEICYSYTFYDTTDFEFEVTAKFNKNTSWSRKGKQYVDLLKHEQLHFDIAQLYARELKQEFESFHYTCNYKEEIAELFNKKKLEYESAQRQYDDETNHSMNKDKQKEWAQLVVGKLTNTRPKMLLAKVDENVEEEKK
jgi:hypothetical protein